jgi:N-acetylglucosamine kinase-like BadF-type ATPase
MCFPHANIYVDHDLVAAAFATYDGTPGISCIMGTGSNSCYFDGDIVKEQVPALGYILGDEGSGSYYGKNSRKREFRFRI